MIISIPPEYGLSEKTELKKCIEKANLNVLKMIATPVAKIICIEEKERNLLLYVEKLVHSQMKNSKC